MGTEKKTSVRIVSHFPALACNRYGTLGCMGLKAVGCREREGTLRSD